MDFFKKKRRWDLDNVAAPIVTAAGDVATLPSLFVATYLLGDVLVVDDLERALSLWRETRTSKTIVTLEGEVIDPHGVVTGGSRESALASHATSGATFSGAMASNPASGRRIMSANAVSVMRVRAAGATEVVSVRNLFETAYEARAARYR